jgi:hypothetical protein
MSCIKVGDLVTLASPTAGDEAYEDPRKKPGIVINIKQQNDMFPRSIYVLWAEVGETESWFEDALTLVQAG